MDNRDRYVGSPPTRAGLHPDGEEAIPPQFRDNPKRWPTRHPERRSDGTQGEIMVPSRFPPVQRGNPAVAVPEFSEYRTWSTRDPIGRHPERFCLVHRRQLVYPEMAAGPCCDTHHPNRRAAGYVGGTCFWCHKERAPKGSPALNGPRKERTYG